jgi:hypothetical protein
MSDQALSCTCSDCGKVYDFNAEGESVVFCPECRLYHEVSEALRTKGIWYSPVMIFKAEPMPPGSYVIEWDE